MNCRYAPLEQDALLHIVGPDSLKFLQGQTTCDTRKISPNHALPGVFCTPQGRVICDFLLCELGPEHFALRMRRDIRTASSAAFGKYIIFSKATLNEAREDWRPIAIWGPDAVARLREVFDSVPAERFGACFAEDYVLVQTDEVGHRFECFLADASSEERLRQMDNVMQEAGEAEWQALQITDGIARIEVSTVEEFIPQTLNYDLTGHISFTKGCYTGQEVVARLHYRGKSKRRAYVAQLPIAIQCTAGTSLYDAESGQSIGNIVNTSSAHDKRYALVTATAEGITNGLHLGAIDGPLLTVGELPYSLGSD